ncbi:MAG: FAD-dependent oxidoreductase [Streptosporangiales bacterium]|nr:FAD-dependent oxidoreductase [Streptosporangiales bacterium]
MVPGTEPVVVIGAGPVGLAAAAHLAERGLPFVVVEAGAAPGESVRQWCHVRLFSPWRYNTDPAAVRLLEAAGWTAPEPDGLPTGAELVGAYLQPLAEHSAIAGHVRYGARVTAISRLGMDRVHTAGRDTAPFVVRLADGEEILAGTVIDASGTWTAPNFLGGNGLPAHGERTAAAWIDHCLPDVLGADRDRYAGRHTLVVGAGHSAATTLLALAELADSAPGTRITWAIRASAPDRAYGGGDDDRLPARGALGSGLRLLVDAGRVELAVSFAVHTIRPLADEPAKGGVEVVGHGPDGDQRAIVADRIVAATGFRPDHGFAGELRLELDPILEAARALAPLIDPNQHSCGTVYPHGVDELAHPEPGYFALGMKSYGRAPTFLLATGYEQARSVVAALAGDWAAARDVRLELPETGACSATLGVREITERLGLAPDVPDKLIAAAAQHRRAAASAADAVLAAAADLGLDDTAALQLAAFAAEFEAPTSAQVQGQSAGAAAR